MFVVYFLENRNLLLSQLRKTVPSVGENLTIKGRKGKVSSVTMEENKVHVQVVLEEKASKTAVLVDNSKKKKR